MVIRRQLGTEEWPGDAVIMVIREDLAGEGEDDKHNWQNVSVL